MDSVAQEINKIETGPRKEGEIYHSDDSFGTKKECRSLVVDENRVMEICGNVVEKR